MYARNEWARRKLRNMDVENMSWIKWQTHGRIVCWTIDCKACITPHCDALSINTESIPSAEWIIFCWSLWMAMYSYLLAYFRHTIIPSAICACALCNRAKASLWWCTILWLVHMPCSNAKAYSLGKTASELSEWNRRNTPTACTHCNCTYTRLLHIFSCIDVALSSVKIPKAISVLARTTTDCIRIYWQTEYTQHTPSTRIR